MKYKNLLMLCFISVATYSQSNGFEKLASSDALLSAGGEGSGGGGSISYSIGQVCYTYITDSKNSAQQGVQHPIKEVADKFDPPEKKNINVVAYPNPMTNYLIVDIPEYQDDNYQYYLYDLNGRTIKFDELKSSKTIIRADHMETAVYLLKITRDGQEFKTFKIIKK